MARSEFTMPRYNSSPNSLRRLISRPINCLPPELIVHIIRIACASFSTKSKLCRWEQKSHLLVNASVRLSHVCSYWRQIVLNLPSLWSHIDLSPEALPSRISAYFARSREALLDVHIVLPYSNTPALLRAFNNDIVPYLTISAPRIRSLRVKDRRRIPDGAYYGPLLATCIRNCTPGTLQEVSIDTSDYLSLDHDPIIRAHLEQNRLTQPATDIFWLPVTVLHFSHSFVDWGSKAYHGLSELRLNGGRVPSASVLISILRCSPQLQVLGLSNFEALPPHYSPLAPIRLDNLRVLALGGIQDGGLASILPLIAPGLEQLSFSLLNPYKNGSNFVSQAAIQNFVTRSNITRLWVKGFDSFAQLAEVLNLMPTVRTLGIHDSYCRMGNGEGAPPFKFEIDALYVLDSVSFTWPSIEQFIQRYSVQKLVLWRFNFGYDGFRKLPENRIPDNLHTICPAVEVLPDSEPNPIDEWF